jgi:mutator protein MutT
LKQKTDHKPHFQVTAGLIWRDGRVLITQRRKGTHLEGFWEFPGGKREGDETLEECLEREIKEELGITIRAERLLVSVDYEYETKSISLHLFQCSQPEGDPEPLECESLRWVPPEELSGYPLPPADMGLLPFVKPMGQT